MTWKQKYNENKKLIKLYDDFLVAVSVSFDDRLKLVTEIGRLNEQNKMIEQMPVARFHQDTNDYTFKIQWMTCITL